MMASKTLRAVITAVIITAVITFVISYGIFKYLPESRANLKVNEYKKELYSSTLCQYSCPLTLQQIQNQTQYFPEPVCVQNCTKSFKGLQANGEKLSNEQLQKDKLIEEMSNAVNACKTEAVDPNTKTLNNTLFFSCSIEKLGSLKDKYSYLR
jgi:mannitol-specific phosphotransferase system IIBC component